MVVLVERRLVARRAAVRKDLHQADRAQDVERAVDRSEADGRQLRADAFVDRLGGQVRAVFERAQDRGALLREAIARLKESCIDPLAVGHEPPSVRPVRRLPCGPDDRSVV